MINEIIDPVRKQVRKVMKKVAWATHTISRGKVTPNIVTIVGLVMHLLIAYFIVQSQLTAAAISLIIFGLFDTLDGELARLQGKESLAGMVLDASTDRMKEVILYSSLAFWCINHNYSGYAVWAVIAVGSSLCISYIKAKGESALNDTNIAAQVKNKMFADGLMRFEIRMFILVLGLLFDVPAQTIAIIAIISTFTALQRLVKVVASVAQHEK